MRTIFPLILRLLLDKRVPLKLKAIPLIAILYVLLPFDFLPDLIPFIGWIDDLAVVVISISVSYTHLTLPTNREV